MIPNPDISQATGSTEAVEGHCEYYISYYDSFDYEWLSFEYVSEYRPEWIFSDLTEATDCMDKLNQELNFGNVRCGEYYDVKKSPESVGIE